MKVNRKIPANNLHCIVHHILKLFYNTPILNLQATHAYYVALKL